MFVSQHFIIFICFIFFTLQQFTTGLLCYECIACDTVNSNTVITNVTNSGSYSCYKVVATSSGVTTVGRGAMLNCAAGTVTIGSVTGSMYCCTTDRCNTGLSLSNSSTLAFIMIALGIIFRNTIFD